MPVSQMTSVASSTTSTGTNCAWLSASAMRTPRRPSSEKTIAERGTATALTAPSSTTISQVTPSGDGRVGIVHARLDAIGPRRGVGAEADEGDLARRPSELSMKRTVASWPALMLPRRASLTAPTASIGSGSTISAISVPTCTAWPTCTGTRSTLPSIGARTATLSSSAWAAASAALAAATPASSAARLLRGWSPWSISFLLASYSAWR